LRPRGIPGRIPP